MYNNKFMCYNNCLIPTPENHNNYHQQTFRNQDRSISNIGDQAALNADARKNKLQNVPVRQSGTDDIRRCANTIGLEKACDRLFSRD